MLHHRPFFEFGILWRINVRDAVIKADKNHVSRLIIYSNEVITITCLYVLNNNYIVYLNMRKTVNAK